ncbi:hypothetical protein B0H66DRAFT_605641 [Apodospora peruviana]|uniref:Uncharacterized protein n=1 Tax=Apodospora peruviana TaxID=516989 RepID=A0AAE0HXJ0_9PEZI|nr:hypothetical protein B0H66DRAFT_605641 [Apodospora peruviana]
MSGHRVFIETDRSGTPIFIRRPSTSSSSHHHRPRSMGDDYDHLRWQYDVLRGKDERLQQSYTEIYKTKLELEAKVQRLQRRESEQAGLIARLQHEKKDLFQAAENAQQLSTKFQDKYRAAKKQVEHLEKENDTLIAEIRTLNRHRDRPHVGFVDDTDVRHLKDEVEEWKRRYTASENQRTRMRDSLDAHIEENVTLKRKNDLIQRSLDAATRLLNRHGIR